MSNPIPKEENYFHYLSNEPPAVFPDEFRAPLSEKSTIELMADRDAALEKRRKCAPKHQITKIPGTD